MALIKCPECEHEVSDSATVCPNCGFTLKKEINMQRRITFWDKYKWIIIFVVALLGVVGATYYSYASRPEVYIKDFMAVYKVSKSDWELNFGSSFGRRGVYSWDDIQLIEGVSGELTLVAYDSSKLKYWKWDVMGNEKTLEKIKKGLSRLSTASSWSIDGYDECYKYKWVEYTEENTGIGDWTKGDEDVTMEMVQGDYHQLLLLKKENKIELQYVPLNRESALNTQYYSIG